MRSSKGRRHQLLHGFIIYNYSVIEFMICQLSSNPDLSKKNLEEFTSLNDVTKDTVKKLWNAIIDN